MASEFIGDDFADLLFIGSVLFSTGMPFA